MLRTKVGYSMNEDSFTSGAMATKNALIGNSSKIGFLYTSCKSNIKDVVKGVRSQSDIPIIGCTSAGAVMIPEGIVASEKGYATMMSMADVNLTVGVACHEAGKNARQIGRAVALEAVRNANMSVAPTYFYMVASPKEEEDYLMGIQDVIGRVPFFGGSAADDSVEGKWKIICNEKVFSDGLAVAFFYTSNDIITKFTGDYRETKNMGTITEVKDDRTLVTINHERSLEKYAEWTKEEINTLRGTNLLVSSVFTPFGIKNPTGDITLIRHPMIGNNNNTMNLGNKIVEGTTVIQMEATRDELINATGETLKELRKSLKTEPAGYILIHSSGRKLGIGNRLEEVHKQLVKEAKGVPFIVPFTFGEYGYSENSANSCGGLMLSFTGFGKE